MTKLSEIQSAVGVESDDRWGPATANAVVKALKNDALRPLMLKAPLSENFTLGEFLRSDTADQRRLLNYPTASQILAMTRLCSNILERVLAHFGRPVRVTSGFRIWTPDSQHGKGEAADFEITGIANAVVARWIRDNLTFDQLILEAWKKNDPNAGWIHCSYRSDRARKSVLRTPTGGPPYMAGLPA